MKIGSFEKDKIACIIFKYFGVTGAHESMLDVTHLMEVGLLLDGMKFSFR